MSSDEKFDRWVSVYKPDYYEGVYEMEKLLRAEDKVIGSFNDKITQTLDDMFVQPATRQGVELFENQLEIVPAAGQTLDERKQTILMHLLPPRPITVRFMRDLFKNELLPVTFDVIYSERRAVVTGDASEITKTRLTQLNYILNTYLPATMVRKIELEYPDEKFDPLVHVGTLNTSETDTQTSSETVSLKFLPATPSVHIKTGFLTTVSTTLRNEVN